MECEGASAKNDCSAFLLSNLPCSEDNFCDILHNSDKREWYDTPVQKVGAAYVSCTSRNDACGDFVYSRQ